MVRILGGLPGEAMATMSTITLHNNMLAVTTPYAPLLMAELKTVVPTTARRWDAANKLWLIDLAHGAAVQALIQKHLGERVALPAGAVSTQPALSVLDLRYLGRVKARLDGSENAFGWVGGDWNAIFPKAALWRWFGQTERPGEAATLYQVLGVQPEAGATEIRTAWKRLAKQWHPDVCREPDAAAQFRAIKDAYEILSDDGKRARYDAGRALEATLRQQYGTSTHNDDSGVVAGLLAAQEWVPPLRCGYVMARGQESVGRFVVAEILAWEDIVRADGCTLVTSWPMGAEHFTEAWV